jgi:hypothetical protein
VKHAGNGSWRRRVPPVIVLGGGESQRTRFTRLVKEEESGEPPAGSAAGTGSGAGDATALGTARTVIAENGRRRVPVR